MWNTKKVYMSRNLERSNVPIKVPIKDQCTVNVQLMGCLMWQNRNSSSQKVACILLWLGRVMQKSNVPVTVLWGTLYSVVENAVKSCQSTNQTEFTKKQQQWLNVWEHDVSDLDFRKKKGLGKWLSTCTPHWWVWTGISKEKQQSWWRV